MTLVMLEVRLGLWRTVVAVHASDPTNRAQNDAGILCGCAGLLEKRVPNLVKIPCTYSGLVQKRAQHDAQILCRCAGLVQKRAQNDAKILCGCAGLLQKRVPNPGKLPFVHMQVGCKDGSQIWSQSCLPMKVCAGFGAKTCPKSGHNPVCP